ncbi:MAG: alpha/beta hydrolase [Leptolyngbya sp. SIO1D8]|nr:alpha/beta hydrolase [Leptolyngbya sp. SIO1D8]
MSFLLKFVIGTAVIYVMLCIVLYFFQEKVIFFPQKLPKDYHFTFQDQFEEVFLENDEPSAARIHALHFFAPQSKGVILYFHGNAGSLAGWGQVGRAFTTLGYDVLIPDYRGYGKSSGKLSQAALFSDAKLCYDYLKGRYPAEDIIIYGRSIGTGVASHLASEVSFRFLILETPFYSLSQIARSYFPVLPVNLLIRYPFESHKYLSSVDTPIYIFHGLKDEIVAYASGKKLEESLAGKNVEMITIPHGNHNNLAQFEKYWEGLKRVLSNEETENN